MQNEIKKSLDKICVEQKVKDDIYNNILRQASVSNVVPIEKNKKFKPFKQVSIAVASLVLIAGIFVVSNQNDFGLYPNLVVDETLNGIENRSIYSIKEPFEYDLYLVVNGVLAKTKAKSISYEVSDIWQEFSDKNEIPSEVKLLDFECEDNITLTFSKEWGELENRDLYKESLEKTLASIFNKTTEIAFG